MGIQGETIAFAFHYSHRIIPMKLFTMQTSEATFCFDTDL